MIMSLNVIINIPISMMRLLEARGFMIICVCKGISDGTIKNLVKAGATSLRQIMATCHAGKDCGSCVCKVKEILENHLGDSSQGLCHHPNGHGDR